MQYRLYGVSAFINTYIMATKQITNETMLKALFKDLTTMEAALLRERITRIAAITRADIAKNPIPYRTPVTTEQDYLRLCIKIDKHIGFKE